MFAYCADKLILPLLSFKAILAWGLGVHYFLTLLWPNLSAVFIAEQLRWQKVHIVLKGILKVDMDTLKSIDVFYHVSTSCAIMNLIPSAVCFTREQLWTEILSLLNLLRLPGLTCLFIFSWCVIAMVLGHVCVCVCIHGLGVLSLPAVLQWGPATAAPAAAAHALSVVKRWQQQAV